MTRKIVPRTTDSLLNETKQRVRTLEAKPGDVGWEDVGDPGAAGTSDPDSTPYLELPLAIRDQSDQLDQNIRWPWTVDATYVNCGYLERTSDGDYLSFLINLRPARSCWIIGLVNGMGSDYGKLDIDLASNPLDTSIFTNDAFPEEVFDLSFVTLQTFNNYNGSTLKNVTWGAANQKFLITGAEGDIGTTFSAGTGSYTGLKLWDGGPGLHRLRLRINGKHASSSGYRQRISQVAVIRVNSGWLW